jgi:hypothetical protein
LYAPSTVCREEKRREGTKRILQHIRSLVLTIFKAMKAEKPVCTCIPSDSLQSLLPCLHLMSRPVTLVKAEWTAVMIEMYPSSKPMQRFINFCKSLKVYNPMQKV